MMTCWGPRAGAVSFGGVLAVIFAIASPTHLSATSELSYLGWSGIGIVAYFLWAVLTSILLQPRYRALSLANALAACARLFRARANLLKAYVIEHGALSLRESIAEEALAADRIQAARDLLFASDTPLARRQGSVLLRVIDVRDIMLASRFDMETLGDDDLGVSLRERLADAYDRMADAFDASARSLREETIPGYDVGLAAAIENLREQMRQAPDDPRVQRLPALVERLSHVAERVAGIERLLRGEGEDVMLSRRELQLFVSPEGWPLSALRANLTWSSPILRHALRTGLALGAAYFIALALPWTSHPHWLVLSVAVVLRGNLEQTLTRRDQRVIGTLTGCLLVLVLSFSPWQGVLTSGFAAASGIAHAFAAVNYVVTSSAASVSALLQSHLLDLSAPFAIPERMADTLLGALLAWGFSYVLPSWEKRTAVQAIKRLLKALDADAKAGLQWPSGKGPAVEQRLMRRNAYDALNALAAMTQRTRVEPRKVRLPPRQTATVLTLCYRMLAHVSLVKVLMSRRGTELKRGEADAALNAALVRIHLAFDDATRSSPRTPTVIPEAVAAQVMDVSIEDLNRVLERRLGLAIDEAELIAHAASALIAQLEGRSAPAPVKIRASG